MILVVDDEPIVARAIQRALQGVFRVIAAHSAQQALDEIRGGAQFDVIICDLMMPMRTGMDLHADLAREAPSLAARMVFLTGGAFTPFATRFLAAIANPVLEKPFDARQLRALVAHVAG